MTEMEFYKGFVPTKNKKCTVSFKGKTPDQLMRYEQIQNYEEYAGILDEETVLIDVDNPDQSEILMNMVEDLQLNCRVVCTTRGKHFLFKNNGEFNKCATGIKLAIGITADIKTGKANSYEVLKFDGIERFIEWDKDPAAAYQQVPYFLNPVKTNIELLGLTEGQGRNDSLFHYELVLQGIGMNKEQTKNTIRLINKYILKDKLPDSELETILRDEALAKPVFFNDRKFLHVEFAKYLMSEFSLKRINGQLYVYDPDEGVYVSGYRMIENKMTDIIPDLKSAQRQEVLKYLEIRFPKSDPTADPNLIAFRNGVLDLSTMKMMEFSPDFVITNKIPWDFNPKASSKLADKTLNKIACGDPQIRALLEECIGYCFYRRNERSKAFMLIGEGSNGKSTFLDMVKNVLGDTNYSSLDLDELSEKFSTSTIFGMLANIGDDISDEFMQGKSVATFKKIVSGNTIKAENKGQDPYFFKPSVKLLFSANELPRFRSKGLQAIMRRLIIIPFNAVFSRDDPDFDPEITWKLQTEEVAEYLIRIGIKGLKRVLNPAEGFTESDAVKKELTDFEADNNPLLAFFQTIDFDTNVLHQSTRDLFLKYDIWSNENGYQRISMQNLSKEVCRKYGLITVPRKKNNVSVRCFEFPKGMLNGEDNDEL